jgi:salicylate hydroxylase
MGPMYSRGLTLSYFFFFVFTPISVVTFFPLPGGLMGVHRAEFHEALLNRLSPRCRTYSSKRLESYSQRPGVPIQLRFHDGSTATCDILVGADGVKSVVRKTMFQDAASWAESQHRNADAVELRNLSELRFSGTLAYRTLIPAARLSSIAPHHRVFSSPVQVRMNAWTFCSAR